MGGKKASRKLHLNYDLDDVQGGGDDDYYDYCSDDDYERNGEEDRIQCSNSPGLPIKQPSPQGQRKESIEKPVVKSFHNNTQNHNDFANTNPQKKDAPPPMTPTRNVVRLYHKRPLGKPFSTVLLEGGHESVLLHIASFLDLRSISALSCTNKCWHQTLANPNLYCSCSVMLLPCMKACPLPSAFCNSSAGGTSSSVRIRSLALESTLFRTQHNSKPITRDKTLYEVFSVIPKHANNNQQVSILESKLFKYGSILTYLTNHGEIISYKLPPSNTSSTASNNKPIYSRRMFPHDCLGVISSVMSSRYCAVLYMPSTGLRRYALSVASLDSSSTPALTMATTLPWQHDILSCRPHDSTDPANSTIALCSHISSRSFTVQMDPHHQWIAVAFRCHFMVFSLSDGKLVWEHRLALKEYQDWHTWTLYDHYILAISSNGTASTPANNLNRQQHLLMIYCLHRKCLVALGRIPPRHKTKKSGRIQRQPPQQDSFSSSPPMIVHNDRVYFTCDSILYGTGFIFKRLQRLAAEATTTTITDLPVTSRVLQIKQFHVLKEFFPSSETEINNGIPPPPILLTQCNETICFAHGNLVHTWEDVNTDNATPAFTSYQVLSAAVGIITSLQVESTKIVCGIQDHKRHKIEIFLRPEFAAVAAGNNRKKNSHALLLYHSVLIRNASVFLDRFQFRHVEFQGGKLLVESQRAASSFGGGGGNSCNYSSAAPGLQESKLQVFHLFDWDDGFE